MFLINNEMPNSLVAGGAGFIGAYVVNKLIAMGYEVVALDDLCGGFKDHANPNALFVKDSTMDRNFLD